MDLKNIENNLASRGFKVSVFETAEDAAKYIDENTDGKSVGFGGSITLDRMGLYDKLKCHNNVFWHWRLPEDKSSAEIRKEASQADVYITSVNALAETGEIINIDGTCNRVSAMIYGHEKVWFVAGANKIATTFDEALFRARNVAAPLNAKRLNKKTPCAAKGDRCYDCKSPDRICRALSVIWEKPEEGEFEIVLINEKLGY